MSRSRVRIGTARKEPAADDGGDAGRNSADRGSSVDNEEEGENSRNGSVDSAKTSENSRNGVASSEEDGQRGAAWNGETRADRETTADRGHTGDRGRNADGGNSADGDKSAGSANSEKNADVESRGNRRKNDSRSWTRPMRRFDRSWWLMMMGNQR